MSDCEAFDDDKNGIEPPDNKYFTDPDWPTINEIWRMHGVSMKNRLYNKVLENPFPHIGCAAAFISYLTGLYQFGFRHNLVRGMKFSNAFLIADGLVVLAANLDNILKH